MVLFGKLYVTVMTRVGEDLLVRRKSSDDKFLVLLFTTDLCGFRMVEFLVKRVWGSCVPSNVSSFVYFVLNWFPPFLFTQFFFLRKKIV